MRLYTALIFSALALVSATADSPRLRARDYGIRVGDMDTGRWNAITDVPGVLVGHGTIVRGDNIRTGVTAILPHDGNIFREKVPAAIYIGNGFGKLVGISQVRELGNIETPIVLTNTLSVGTAMTAVVRYTLDLPGNETVRSVNAVVGETNDGYLNDIRGMHVTEEDVRAAIGSAATGPVGEGSVGAGTGTMAFGFKGGIGTSSRIVAVCEGRYTLGVLVQTNYGGDLRILGVPVSSELRKKGRNERDRGGDGSCMIVVATDAPLDTRNLERIAKRALFGLARTGSVMSNGSGDYVIAFSTAYRIPHGAAAVDVPAIVPNDRITTFFTAVIDATEEAVYNSLFRAETVTGRDGNTAETIPLDRVTGILTKRGALSD